ncbi:MAG TPA: hypothetical protein VJS64_01645 [Pyrinomonadaceae bacterium]|nr:hypothetical protein [Pyrinomonadaceae bacterium]
MNYTGNVFKNTRIPLCGNNYKKCVFDHCLLVFDASDTYNLEECDLTTAKFGFADEAGTTLLFLTNLYRDSPEKAEEIFEDIRKGLIPPNAGN